MSSSSSERLLAVAASGHAVGYCSVMITSVIRTPLAWVAAAGLLLAGCSSTSTGTANSTAPTTASAAVISAPASSAPISGSATGSVPAPSAASASSSAPASGPVASGSQQPSDNSVAPSGSAAPSSAPTGSKALKAIPLQGTDLPAGYTATPYKADPSDKADQAALVTCVGGKDTSTDKTADANSATFTKGDLRISSSATKYKSQSDLDADIAILKSSKVSACYETLFKSKLASSLPAGATVQSVSIKIIPGAAGGPGNVVGKGAGKITVTAGGSKQEIYVSVAFITGPLIEAEVDFTSVGVPVTSAVQADLVAKVAKRAAAS